MRNCIYKVGIVALFAMFASATVYAGSHKADPLSLLSSNPKKIQQRHAKAIKRARHKETRTHKKYRKRHRAKKRYRKRRALRKHTPYIKTPLGKVYTADYTSHAYIDNPYLQLKAIDGPLPDHYAPLYLQAKVLPPKVDIVVDKSDQRIYVHKNDELLYIFKTSTARRGYYTPTGRWKPKYITRMHYSKKYHNSPMPWSVFYHGGFAIHGTGAISRLGRPASHGCVRAHPSSAKKIYSLVRRYGKQNTTITVRN